jgi:large subunit ribosomal protein L10
LAISKEKKQQMVADYVDKMSNSQAVILTDYRGLSVAAITDLRRRLRESGGVFQVVKNTLFELALQDAGLPVPTEQMDGPIAAGYCLEEVPPVAKALVDFADETGVMVIRGAILGTSFLDAGGVKGLANLPPREILLAQLLGSVQGPMSGLVSTLAAPMRELVQVLQARAEQGADGASQTEAAA